MATKDLSVVTPMEDIVSQMEAAPSQPESPSSGIPPWQITDEDETPADTAETPEKGAKDGPQDKPEEAPSDDLEDEDEEELEGLARVATKNDLKDPVLKARVEQLEKGYQKELAKITKKSEVRDSYWNAFENPDTRQDAFEKLGQQLGITATAKTPATEAKADVITDEQEEALYAKETASETKARWLKEFRATVTQDIRAELEKEYGDVVSYTREQKQTHAMQARAKEATADLQGEFGDWLTTDLIAQAFQKFPELENTEAIGAAYAARIRKHFANISPRRSKVPMPKHETAEAEGWVPGKPYSMTAAYQDVVRERETG